MNYYSKQLTGASARKELMAGARMVYKAVSTTLGVRGRNIVLHKDFQTRVIHDGYEIAKQVNPKDEFKASGATILKQSAIKQVNSVGDGTTAVIILGYSIAKEATKYISSGINPMALQSGLEKGRDLLVNEINRLSKPVKTEKQKIEVATISAQDKHLGELIGKTFHKIGLEGVITVENSSSSETYMDHQDGMQMATGYASPYFVTNPQKMLATVTEPRILVTNYTLNDMQKLIPLLDKLTKVTRNIVIIADKVEGSAFASILQNKMEGKLNALIVKAPLFQQLEHLQDIATVVGAKFISKEAEFELENIELEDLGQADKIISSNNSTLIMGGKGNKKEIKTRADSIRTQLTEADSDHSIEKLKERLARLTGGVYVVKVGGVTETDIDKRIEKAKDAILATRAGIEEGIVPGGEVIYHAITKVLEPENEDEEYAYRILTNALHKPFEKLLSNAGISAGEMIANLDREPFGYGVDVTDKQIKDMVKSGIVDPSKVCSEAIKNAVSVGINILTSDGIVCHIEKEPVK